MEKAPGQFMAECNERSNNKPLFEARQRNFISETD
jgi:hypothetical protein